MTIPRATKQNLIESVVTAFSRASTFACRVGDERCRREVRATRAVSYGVLEGLMTYANSRLDETPVPLHFPILEVFIILVSNGLIEAS